MNIKSVSNGFETAKTLVKKSVGNGFETIGKTLSSPETKNLGEKFLQKVGSINEPIKSAVNPTMFAVALYSCVLGPRAKAAAKRSSIEKREVITRDAFAITTLVFALKAINGAIAKAAQKSTGLVLTSETKPLKDLNPLQKFFEFVRPSKGVQVLSSEELASKLTLPESAGTKELKGLVNWLENNGGNAKKAFSIVDKKTSEIIGAIDESVNKDGVKNIIEILKSDKNPLIKKAKFVNSGIIKTLGLAVVVAILGVGVQMFNQFMTKKLDKKKEAGEISQEEYEKSKEFINRLTPEQMKTFQNFLGAK